MASTFFASLMAIVGIGAAVALSAVTPVLLFTGQISLFAWLAAYVNAVF